MKGIILAGGSGTRLYPATQVVSKQLIPVYDKPMVYYPLATLMLAGIRDILLISTPQDTPRFEQLLGDGHKWGINISYAVQPKPEGLPQAFIIGEKFIGKDPCALILGDNIFYGHDLTQDMQAAMEKTTGATIFAYQVQDPERSGVVEFDKNRKVISIEEKPKNPKSKFAVTGFFVYDNKVVDIARGLKPSARGELEITDVSLEYMRTGTHASLLEASMFIETIEKRQGLKIACPEEIAYRMGYISADQLVTLTKTMGSNGYGKYLSDLLLECPVA